MASSASRVARWVVVLARPYLLGLAALALALSAAAQTAQTITFGALANKTYGAAPFTVSATASSGLTVSFASLTTPVCTVSGTTVTIVAAGTCTIQASQAGNATYAPAANVNQSFTVAKANQTITFGALASKTYGNAPFAVSATASSGLAVSFTSTTAAVCTVSASTVTIVTAGTCSIKASQAGNGNYNAATAVTQSFTVAKAAQTITFGALAGKTYGAAPFAVNATASSGLAVSFASTTAAVCTVSGNTVTIVAGGTCSIKATQAGNGNYNAATAVTQSFTVAKAAQTITFGALAGKTYGVAPFAVSATASSGLAVTFTSTTAAVCTVSASTVTIVTAGTCSIKASQAGNGNYNAATAVTQSFTVAKAAQTITFGALAGKTYGAAPFAVSATASSGLTVAFASTTAAVCTVSGVTVTIVAGGTCSIQASQAGNADYVAASAVTQSFTVAKAAQTITFGALANQTYGVTPFAVSATASSGLAISFSSTTSAVCTVSGHSVTVVAVGTCTIQAAQAGNGNYNPAPNVSQSFTVTAGAQTINFTAPGNRLISASPVVLNASASSGLTVSFTSLTPVVCTVSGNLATLVASGLCTVQATQAGDASYSAAPSVNQSFIVIAVPQFAAPVTYNTGNSPQSIAVGDFNGDGIPDLAIANSFSGSVTILLGNGDGTFTAATPVSTGGIPYAVAVGDFNGDGKVDLAVADIVNGVILIFAGKGDGTFTQLGTVSVGQAPISIAVADFNGDGKLDLAVANGTYGGPTGQTVTVVLGHGDGTFGAPTSYPTGPNPYAVVAADFNGDGKSDLAVANADNNTVSVLLGHGDGTFTAAVNYATDIYPDGLAVADLNGDGKLDLAVVDFSNGDVSILLGRGDGTFAPATNIPVGSGPLGVAIADFNGDGLPDLAIANSVDKTVAVLLGNGDGTFQPPLVYSGVGTQPYAIVAKDLNGGGKPDIVVADASGSSVAVLLQPRAPPASLTVQSGGVQTAAAGATYATPMAVLVQDATGHPLVGVSITFTAPASGASGTFAGGGTVADATSNSAGVATAPAFTANANAGSFTVTATVGALSAVFALTNTSQAPMITSVPPPGGTIDVAYSYPVAASGAPFPTFSVSSGALPPGLNVDVNSGVISGTPSSSGTFAGVITASNGVSPAATQTFSIVIGLQTQTIAFAAIPQQTLGAPPPSLSATASSGLSVSFASLTPSVCGVGGNTVALNAAGTCTIVAAQTGNGIYSAAPSVDQSFAVNAGGQAITFNAISDRAFNIGPLTLSATASSGLPVGLATLTPGVCLVSGNVLRTIAVGTCTVEASQAGNANYSAAASVDRNFNVTAATQSLIFSPPGDHNVNDSPFVLSAETNSGLPITFSSLTPSVCTAAGNLATLVATGTCTISATQLGNANFLPATVNQTFAVTTLGYPPPTPSAFNGPFIEYSTYLGGLGDDSAFAAGVGPDGSAYVSGAIASTSMPALSSAQLTNAGQDLAYVAKLGPSRGELVTATVVGGRAPDITGTGSEILLAALQSGVTAFNGAGQVEAMTVDALGNVYVAAYANTTNFPASGGTYVRDGAKYIFQVSPSGGVQAASAALDPAVQTVRALAVDPAGSVYFTGFAAPGLATTTGAVIPAPMAPSGGPYLIKLAPGGASVAYATYLSVKGSRNGTQSIVNQSTIDAATTAYAIAVDAAGNAYLTGQATADDFPVTPGSPDTADTQHRDAFVAKVNPTGTALAFVARLGGADADRGTSIALSPDGSIVVGGKTATQPFVGKGNVFQLVVLFQNGTPVLERETGFVAKLSADGKQWEFIAAVGTTGGNLVINYVSDPSPVKVAVDASGAIYVAGTTFSDRSLPVLSNLPDVSLLGAFVMKISADGSQLLYSTTLGDGIATGLAVDPYHNALVAGYGTGGLPAVSSGQALPGFGEGFRGAFVVKLNDAVAPVVLTSAPNPALANQTVSLTATLSDGRDAGAFEFFDGGQYLGTVAISSGTATLPVSLSVGVHRLTAVYEGGGVFAGTSSFEVIQVVNQAPLGP